MNLLIKDHTTAFPLAKAEDLVKTLNADPEDDWTYKVVPNPKTEGGLAIVEMYDEDNVLVGNL